MVSRISKKILSIGLILVSLLLLSSCEVNHYHEYNNHYYGVSDDVQINEVFKILNQHYYEKLPIDISQLSSVDEIFLYTDRYTYIYEVDTRSIDQGSAYVGVGITIQEHKDGLLVTKVNTNIEANKDVYAGDIITHINDTKLEGLDFSEKTQLLRGELDETRVIKITRINQEVTVTLTLVSVATPSVTFKYFNDIKIGYIKIDRFEGDTHVYFNESLQTLENLGMENLIIDVRDNGGGYLNATVEILRNFVYGNEPFVYVYYSKANYREAYRPNKSAKKPYEIITLINTNSASASEMLAGTLMQYDYKSFGDVSYGKDLFQGSVALTTFGENMRISMTMGYWILKDDTTVRGGIQPNINHVESGVRMFNQPILNKVYEKGHATSALLVYQYLLSQKVEGSFEFGLFDSNLEQMILTYQQENNIELTGKLDIDTQTSLIDFYRELINDVEYDNLLNGAIKYINENWTFNN